jgi:hypothetical protein
VNDPKMNSMFSIDLINRWARRQFYQQHVVGFRIAIPERIKMVREYINWVGDGNKFYQ